MKADGKPTSMHVEFMKGVLPLLDEADYVYRYSWTYSLVQLPKNSSYQVIPFPAVAGETSLLLGHCAITCPQAFAMVSASLLQLCRLLGSLNPIKKVRFTFAGMLLFKLERHQFIGVNLSSKCAT